jgi:hypothetical protein
MAPSAKSAKSFDTGLAPQKKGGGVIDARQMAQAASPISLIENVITPYAGSVQTSSQ